MLQRNLCDDILCAWKEMSARTRNLRGKEKVFQMSIQQKTAIQNNFIHLSGPVTELHQQK